MLALVPARAVPDSAGESVPKEGLRSSRSLRGSLWP